MATFRLFLARGAGPTPPSWSNVVQCSTKWLPHFCEPASRPKLHLHIQRTCISSPKRAGGQRRCGDWIPHKSTHFSVGDAFSSSAKKPLRPCISTRTHDKAGGSCNTMPCELMIFIAARTLRQLNSLSIVSLHFGPKRLMAQIVRLLNNAQTPKIVNSQPLPTAFMTGAATMAPTQENMFLTKLLTATPLDDCLGMNSVSIVVATAKISIDPIP